MILSNPVFLCFFLQTDFHGIFASRSKRASRRHMKQVKSFRPGVYGEGEDGVTIVTLK